MPAVDPVTATTQTIADLHARAERHVEPSQRAIEAITHLLGRPNFLYSAMAFLACWIAINLTLIFAGRVPFDPPPFPWLQGIVSTIALFTTITVLITQRRQDRVDERRGQLDLHISMLVEQETSKVIALLEELRRDLPNVPNRRDPEAETMASEIDHRQIVVELERVLEDSAEIVADDEEAKDDTRETFASPLAALPARAAR